MPLVMANSISISVRERNTEMAVKKVLGLRSDQAARLVIGEALLACGLSGLAVAEFTYSYHTGAYSGIPFTIAFIPVFHIPLDALAWGTTIGLAWAVLSACCWRRERAQSRSPNVAKVT